MLVLVQYLLTGVVAVADAVVHQRDKVLLLARLRLDVLVVVVVVVVVVRVVVAARVLPHQVLLRPVVLFLQPTAVVGPELPVAIKKCRKNGGG